MSNTGGSDGGLFMIIGKAGLRDFLIPVVAMAETRTVPCFIQVANGVARVVVDNYLRHRSTGHVISGRYRQIITFEGGLIAKLEEVHDAALMRAFWTMVETQASTTAGLDD